MFITWYLIILDDIEETKCITAKHQRKNLSVGSYKNFQSSQRYQNWNLWNTRFINGKPWTCARTCIHTYGITYNIPNDFLSSMRKKIKLFRFLKEPGGLHDVRYFQNKQHSIILHILSFTNSNSAIAESVSYLFSSQVRSKPTIFIISTNFSNVFYSRI